ncbi:very short patch repair endonuclease [Acidovorax sp. SUPP2522]|uniref:very short patch repair endonuclease n=1 Tax=unclassified Acidovorax TaxID=2684926 RepID=UPI0023497E02|nr:MULTISPECIES: very short patch repair endonuclease [unclassified Acidovorax]WCM96388.1 very short patch repair endonuclease [Acidovorax sp. GBBC 1281]GKT14973.1 very short patch repair endonuclease [Acidovorax sp. SUPP2522]
MARLSKLVPTSSDTSRRMAKVRQKGTDAELALRREMYRLGLRYRIDFQVLKQPRRVADVAFPGRKIAVFVDGCFWHGCPQHATWPKNNADFWRQKIEANRRRDVDTTARLEANGWTVLRFWSHESPNEAAKAVARVVAQVDATRLASSSAASDEN